MKRLKRILSFAFQSIVLGLALAFLAVWLRPDLLGLGRGFHNGGGDPAPGSYADAVNVSAPAVVNIHTAKRVSEPVMPFLNDPQLRRYFGDQLPSRERIESTLGSGVIVHDDGYILTNHHVIAGAEAIQVALYDGRVLEADVVGTDSDTDLALLKVDAQDLPVITLGRSDNLRVGDVVLAIGNPFGVGQTVTQGIVSATGRNYLGHANFENFIQTDAAMNRGNSGGALVNTRGELIGVNTAIFSLSGGSNGVGFAVPVNLARGVMEQLIEHGRVIRGWLGVDPQDLTPALAEAFGLPDTNGVVVLNTYPGSPAEMAGLQRYDVITHINDEPVKNMREALSLVARMTPGETIRIRGIRAGEPFVFKATITERDPSIIR